tara:strand:- start:1093 stop:1461 length:369 start_codon:yes stop_codon:yes gene_type:complete
MTLNLEQFLFTILPHGEQTVSINYQDSIGEFKTERVVVNKANRDAFIVPVESNPALVMLTQLIAEQVTMKLEANVPSIDFLEELNENKSEILEIVRDSCLFAETDSVPEIVRDVVRNATIEV